jgi:hypothetical protein
MLSVILEFGAEARRVRNYKSLTAVGEGNPYEDAKIGKPRYASDWASTPRDTLDGLRPAMSRSPRSAHRFVRYSIQAPALRRRLELIVSIPSPSAVEFGRAGRS